MAMRLPTMSSGQALFTIEQIELLRRLRNSGLTKEQISNAFENLDRLDKELGPVYNIPITQVANAVTFQQMQAQASQMATQVANQIALSAQVAKAAQVAQAASLPTIGTQPVFPHPIAIAPMITSTAPSSTPQMKTAVSSLLQNGTATSTGGSTGSEQNSPVSARSSGTPVTSPVCGSVPPAASLMLADSTVSRKRSPSSDTNDSLTGSELAQPPAPKMVQVNGSVMVPAELTKQHLAATAHVAALHHMAQAQTPTPLMTSSPLTAAAVVNNNHLHPHHHHSMNAMNANSNTPIAKPEFKFEGIPEISDTNEEYIAFLGKGERACCEEIKEFVQKYNIRQQQIATLSGISQPYISRFLRGEFSEMSHRSRRIIIKWFIAFKNHPTAIGMCQSYVSRFLRGEFFDMSGRSRQSIIKWYLAYKNCPNTIAAAVSAVLMANGHPPAKRFISALDVNSGEFVNTPRRERFVFRPNHVVILEKYFADDSYPSYEKREEIARTLNASTEASTGKLLEEREIVTAQIISNWFANKRKEMKKIAREEGLDISQVPIRPRGRPSGRFFLSNMVGAPGEQATDLSLANMADRIHPGELVFPSNHLPMVSSAPADLSQTAALLANEIAANNSNLVATDLSLEPGLVEKDANDNEAATDLSMNGNRNAPLDGTRDNDGNMPTPDLQVSYVNDDVEFAAVNQAILSLTGQAPIGIKIEEPDVEPDSKGVEA